VVSEKGFDLNVTLCIGDIVASFSSSLEILAIGVALLGLVGGVTVLARLLLVVSVGSVIW